MKFKHSEKFSTNEVYEYGDWVLVDRDGEAFLFYNKKYDKIREGWGITIDKAVEDYIRNLTMYIEKFNKLKSEAEKIAGNVETE